MSDLLENLNPGQRLAVETIEGPLLVLAGAGSGKTKTIIHRMAHMVLQQNIPAHKIVAVTFTNKAAQEIQERAIAIGGPPISGCLIRTYHSFGLLLLRSYASYFDYPSSFNIWDEDDARSVIQRILRNQIPDQEFQKTHTKYFSQKISSFKDELLTPEDLNPEMLADLEFGELLPQVYHLYEQEKENSRSFDFADLLFQSVTLLKSYPDLLEKLQQKYQYFMVDEYQDTNLAQYTLVQMLTQKHQNLCVVGDDDQAIYGWRGANVSNILNFQQDFPNATIAKLEQNYRSIPGILQIANEVIKNNPDRLDKTMTPTRDGDRKPKLLVLPDDVQEAAAVAQLAKALEFEHPWKEIAILYRTNTQSRLIEEALLKLEIPYRVFGGISFFARKEIKDILAYLRFVVNTADTSSLIRLLQNPSKGIGEKSVDKLLAWRQDNPSSPYLEILKDPSLAGLSGKAAASMTSLYEWLEPLSRKVKRQVDLGLLFEDVLLKSGLRSQFEEEDRLTGTERMENLNELKGSMLSFTHQQNGSLDEYLQSISLYTSTEDAANQNGLAVNLMTVHNAKGLEFPVVILVGLDEEIFPHFFAIRSDSISEERRLFYVGSTRAMDKLYLTRAQRRQKQGLYAPSNPSRFLNEIPYELLEESKQNSGPRNPENYFRSGAVKPKPKQNFVNEIMPAAPKQKSGNFQTGDKLKHPTFGTGKVVKLEGSGDGLKVHLYFAQEGKTRKFVAKFVNLQKA